VFVIGDEAVTFLHIHFIRELVSRLSTPGELSGSRYYLIKKLILELMVPVLVGLVGALIHRLRSHKRFFSMMQLDEPAMMFFFVGLSGSLPLLVIPVQMGWYLFPSLPFFIISIAMVFGRQASQVESFVTTQVWGRRLMLVLAVVCLSVSLVCAVFLQGKLVVRNKAFYADMVSRPLPIPPRSKVSVHPPGLMKDWFLAANLQRLFRISITAVPGEQYMITAGPLDTESFPAYTPVHDTAPVRYHLYQRMGQKP
jgi:hypothetical protein